MTRTTSPDETGLAAVSAPASTTDPAGRPASRGQLAHEPGDRGRRVVQHGGAGRGRHQRTDPFERAADESQVDAGDGDGIAKEVPGGGRVVGDDVRQREPIAGEP